LKAIFAAAVLLLPALALAQIPAPIPANQTIGYQGRLLKKDGSPVTGKVDAVFRIYDKDGTKLWEEPQSVTPNPQGFYAVFLGSVAAFQATLFNGSDDRWLGITLGADSELIPRQKIASVAHALMASGVANDAVGTAQLADGAVTASKLRPAEAWIAPTLLNGWVNFGNIDAGYYRDATGTVRLHGWVKNGAVAAAMFTLPTGYRPSGLVNVPCNASNGLGFLQIEPNGNVSLGIGSNVFVILDALSFRAEQ
jgi:hypothetical protein